MDSRNKIIDQIFKILAPLRATYKNEVEKVSNDLLIGYTQSLDDFINKYYGNSSYSPELVSLIVNLVNQGIIPATYLDEVNKKNVQNAPHEITYKQVSVKPLNVKIITFNKIQAHKDLAKLDKTKYPVSLFEEKKEEQEDIPIELIHTNPNLAPVEISPDEDTLPDIVLPKEDFNMEMPEIGKVPMPIETQIAPEQPVNVQLPDINPAPAINPSPELNITPPTLEAQPIMSKEDIFNSINNQDNDQFNIKDYLNTPVAPTVNNESETENPDLKNTSQFGQILQFPLNNQAVPAQQVALETAPQVAPQMTNVVPMPNVQPIAENQVAMPAPTPEVQMPTQTTYQPISQYIEPAVQPIAENQVAIEAPTPEVQMPTQTTYQTTSQYIEPAIQPIAENQVAIEAPTPEVQMPTQTTYQTTSQYIEPAVQPIAENQVAMPAPTPETQIPTPIAMPEIEMPQPVYYQETNYEEPIPTPTYQEPISVDLPTPEPEYTTPPIPQPETYMVAETPKQEAESSSYSKEQLREEIVAEVREEVKKQVTKEITEKIRLEEKNNIVKIQNDYMNNATAFIQGLNEKSEEEIYMSLRYLNDLKYMSHCIAHLNINTLERFYKFIENKINSPQSEFMDGFIEKRIRENLPSDLLEAFDEQERELKKVA